jgi:hypothetical protein
VNSVTTPIGGVSWSPPAPERETLRKLVVFLEDRRALFDPYDVEATVLVQQSVQQIRAELTGVLQSIGEDSRAAEPLRTMRAACQRYLIRLQAFPISLPGTGLRGSATLTRGTTTSSWRSASFAAHSRRASARSRRTTK